MGTPSCPPCIDMPSRSKSSPPRRAGASATLCRNGALEQISSDTTSCDDISRVSGEVRVTAPPRDGRPENELRCVAPGSANAAKHGSRIAKPVPHRRQAPCGQEARYYFRTCLSILRDTLPPSCKADSTTRPPGSRPTSEHFGVVRSPAFQYGHGAFDSRPNGTGYWGTNTRGARYKCAPSNARSSVMKPTLAECRSKGSGCLPWTIDGCSSRLPPPQRPRAS